MREFEKYEMFKAKCPVCGSKNKVHTELMSRDGSFVGYSLKCCNCGNYNEFLLDYQTNGKIKYLPYQNGKERCIQPSYCPRKDCPLYGTCTVEQNATEFGDEKKNLYDPEYESNVDIDVINSPRFL